MKWNLKTLKNITKFQMKKEWKRFIILAITLGIFTFLYDFLFYYFPAGSLYELAEMYFKSDVMLYFFTFIGATLLFSGIISEDYDKKTGLVIFPKLSKPIFSLGKFLGSFIYMSLIMVLIYSLKGLFSFYYYATIPLLPYFTSFYLALFFLLAVGGFNFLLSALFNNENKVIIFSLLLSVVGFNILELIMGTIFPYIEPFFSLEYLYKIILKVYEITYVSNPFEHRFFKNSSKPWSNPTIPGAIISMIVYFIITFLIGMIISKKKEL